MVIDSSALVAILLDEPERRRFVGLIGAANERLISAASLLETAIVISARKGSSGTKELNLFIDRAEIHVLPVDREQVEVGHAAYLRYGRGRHPARLNYGDCFSYAAAKVTGHPLLFKGNEFPQTDLPLVEF